MHETALVAFAKDPSRTRVKTRLKNELSEIQRSSIYTALLKDCLTQLSSIASAKTYIACFPDKTSSFFSELSHNFNATLLNQKGSDLGERMYNCFDELLKNHEKVIIFGTDVPLLPVEDIESKLPEPWDALIGPSEDGGYYAIGLSFSSKAIYNSGKLTNIFANVPFSSGKEYDATLSNCRNLNLNIEILKPARDLDTLEDLKYFSEQTEKLKVSEFHKNLAEISRLKQVKR